MAGTFERRSLVDWPTLLVIGAFWIALVALVLFGGELPSVAAIAGLATLGCLYMSLQHESIHGHPTPSKLLNRLIVGPPLGLIQPFSSYTATHMRHHDSDLTDPLDDPESFYVLPATWERSGPAGRLLLQANRTLAFRMTVGPLFAVWRSFRFDLRRVRTDVTVAFVWLVHVVGVSVVVFAVDASSLPLWQYMVGFVYGGAALTALRSFAEHRAVDGAPRSAVVHTGWFFSLLFLNNNLHHTHHQLPGAAWFRLPELNADLGSDLAVADGAGCYPSYWALFRRHLFRPFDEPVHPLSATIRA